MKALRDIAPVFKTKLSVKELRVERATSLLSDHEDTLESLRRFLQNLPDVGTIRADGMRLSAELWNSFTGIKSAVYAVHGVNTLEKRHERRKPESRTEQPTQDGAPPCAERDAQARTPGSVGAQRTGHL